MPCRPSYSHNRSRQRHSGGLSSITIDLPTWSGSALTKDAYAYVEIVFPHPADGDELKSIKDFGSSWTHVSRKARTDQS